jgi:hypothetical protein
VTIGIALRYALALGLHLSNEDQTVEIARKERLVQTWWALQTFEGDLSMMLGRPSLVVKDHYSTPLPLASIREQLSHENMASYSKDCEGWDQVYNDIAAGFDPPSPGLHSAGLLLSCLANVNTIVQDVMTSLYSATSTNRSWKEKQETIAGLCEELEIWSANLPPWLNALQPSVNGGFTRERLIIRMNYIRVKIMITRPCLSILASRTPKQTKITSEFNDAMARKCVDAAKTLVDILPDQPNATYLYHICPWWSIPEHC